MKTRFLKVQLLFMMLLISMKLSAAVVYPIVLNPQILPPYSNCLLDYAASKRFNVFALSRDMNHANYTFCLNIKMKHGNSYLIDETVYDVRFTVASGVPKIVDITSLLDRVDNQSNEGFCYEEGAYEFIFQAFDANNLNIAVSEPAYLLAYLSKSEPPMCIYPNDNDCISPNIGGVINFSWTESFAAVPDPSRKFRIAIYEMPDGLFDEGADYSTRQRKSRLNSLVETQVPIFMDETSVPFYSFINTTGKLQKNHTYLWRVQIYKDGTNPDGKYTTSGYYKNGGWSEPFTLRYRNCDPWSQEIVKQEKESNTDAPDLEVEVSDAVTISWKTDPDKYCGYRVGYNVKGQDSVIEWTTQTFAQNESSWVISKNITPGVDYVAKIEGITDCPDTAYTKSNKKDFKVQYKANNDCKSNIPVLSLNDNIGELKAGDIIDACGKSVKVTNVERNANGTFSGQGIALLPILSDWTGIRVKFEGIKVNSSKEMTSGHIESTTGSSPLTLNINGVANKQNAGTKTNLQKKIADSKPESSQVAIKVEGKKVSVSGNAIGTIVEKEEVGNISDEDKVGENGKITFAAKVYGNPVIDEGMSPFNGLQISSYYEVPGQWIALEAGMSTKLVAKFTKGDVDINLDSVSIYIQAEEDAVKIENLKWSATNECEFTIFAGKETEHLNLIAVDKSKGSLNILGRAFIQSMKREEITLHLVPVRRNSSSVKNDAISERLNAIYNPLGKHFTVEVEGQFDEKKELGFLDDGLDVSETSLLSLESKEMKELTQAYVDAHPGIEDSKDAYIFICPSAKDKNVKGDMPRNKNVGYVFSSATTYGTDTDAWTIAHELGHGIFDLEHTFDFGVNKNTTKNLMDYSQGTETKVWQWTVMDNHPSYTLPFLEDAEDSQWTTDGHYYLFTYIGMLMGVDYDVAKKYGCWAERPDTYVLEEEDIERGYVIMGGGDTVDVKRLSLGYTFFLSESTITRNLMTAGNVSYVGDYTVKSKDGFKFSLSSNYGLADTNAIKAKKIRITDAALIKKEIILGYDIENKPVILSIPPSHEEGDMLENTTWAIGGLQQLYHSLTGGYHGIELAFTAYAIQFAKKLDMKKDVESYLLHRFGDVFAHFDIRDDRKGFDDRSLYDYIVWLESFFEDKKRIEYNVNTKETNIEAIKGKGEGVYYVNSKFYSTYCKDTTQKKIVKTILSTNSEISSSSVRYAKLKEFFWDEMENSANVSAKQNGYKMYGDGVTCKNEGFTLGHFSDGGKPDEILRRSDLFLLYVKRTMELYKILDDNAYVDPDKNPYDMIKDVIEWGKEHERKGDKLDGIFRFLIEIEKSKDPNKKSYVFEIPIKSLPDEISGSFSGVVTDFVNGGKEGFNESAEKISQTLKNYLNHVKDKYGIKKIEYKKSDSKNSYIFELTK